MKSIKPVQLIENGPEFDVDQTYKKLFNFYTTGQRRNLRLWVGSEIKQRIDSSIDDNTKDGVGIVLESIGRFCHAMDVYIEDAALNTVRFVDKHTIAPDCVQRQEQTMTEYALVRAKESYRVKLPGQIQAFFREQFSAKYLK